MTDQWGALERAARAALDPSRNRATDAPGGTDCQECGAVFVGSEYHAQCGVCIAMEYFHKAANPAAVLELIAAARGVRGGDEPSSASALNTSHRNAEGAVVGWQPIETAPRDGTVIIVGGTPDGYGPKVRTAHWGSGRYLNHKKGFQQAWVDHPGHTCDPTHWMPLPAPPASDTTAGDEPKASETNTADDLTGREGA